MHMSLPLIAILATASFASPLGAADTLATLEKRYDKTRLTQHATHTCDDTDADKIHRDISWSLDCVTIDGATNSMTFNLGTGPNGHSRAVAYSKSECSGDSSLGEIYKDGTFDPANGECIDVNTHMISEPNSFGSRINSIKFA